MAYAKATQRDNDICPDNICDATGWSGANARCRVTAEDKVTGTTTVSLPKRGPRTYQSATITLMTRIRPLAGEPCDICLAVVIADELERLECSADLLTDDVIHQLLSMSPATMERYLAPVRDARYPAGPGVHQARGDVHGF